MLGAEGIKQSESVEEAPRQTEKCNLLRLKPFLVHRPQLPSTTLCLSCHWPLKGRIQLLCCCSFAAGSSKGHPRTQASYESVQWLDSTRPEVSEIFGHAKVFYQTQCFSGSQSSPIYRYTYIYKQFILAHLGTVCGSLTPSQLETRRDWSEIAHLGTVCGSPTPSQLEMRRDWSESRHRTLAQGEWSKETCCTPPLVQALLSAMPPSPHCLAV